MSYPNKQTTSTIRFAKESDAETIANIHVASWQKIYRGHIQDAILDGLSVSTRTQQWHALIKQGVKIFVIEHRQQIMGFASICPARDADMQPKQCGEISAIYLHPKLWRQGLGKKLCTAAIAELGVMGFTQVILWVLESNIQARRFYEKLGFINLEQTKTDILSACMLGITPGEKATENTSVVMREVLYSKQLLKTM